MISIDPHWGTSLRYRTLKEFWELYPSIGYFDDPRSWKVFKDSPHRIRLEAKSLLAVSIYSENWESIYFLPHPLTI